MKKLLALMFACCMISAYADDPNDPDPTHGGDGLGPTNEVMTVDQNGQISAGGVATIEAVASNAVNVQIAMESARIAVDTAIATTNAIQAIVDNIMSNRVIVYRRGFIDSFAALTIITDLDTCPIIGADWIKTAEETGGQEIVVDVYYCCSADVSAVKPGVYTHNTLDNINGRIDFELCPEMWVTEPTYYPEEKTYDEVTYDGYYKVRVTIPNPGPTTKYFLFIKLEGNDPGGTGAQLLLRNGIKGGITGDMMWGENRITVKGGLIKGNQVVQ